MQFFISSLQLMYFISIYLLTEQLLKLLHFKNVAYIIAEGSIVGGKNLSKAKVEAIAKEIDEELRQWLLVFWWVEQD